ncbi:hypothetical protein BZG36_01075 [Bifiguratus adelaidae]|uniref:K Homology domain-containing protein n=1 Tax=Bifiguratus adelaidae TaxID=1938954 RepID=A0A261Y5Y5_9FUNG|nr:hypothetical protein BZG36_01075 [Bifiguratus adelaidae]
MDQIAYSFCFPNYKYQGSLHPTHTQGSSATAALASADEANLTALHRVCEAAAVRHGCHAAVSAVDASAKKMKTATSTIPQKRRVGGDGEQGFNVTLSGLTGAVAAARGDIFRHNPIQTRLPVKAPKPSHIASVAEFQDLLRPHINNISQTTNTTITLHTHTNHRRTAGFQSECYTEVIICGTQHDAEVARVRVLVTLDELAGLKSDSTVIPQKLHNIVSGRKRCFVTSIMEETATNIYFPSPFMGIHNPTYADEPVQQPNDAGDQRSDSVIYITGDALGISRAKEMLNKLAAQKAKSMYHKDAMLHSRKLDWMLMQKQDEIKPIMQDNGSFILFPVLGSSGSTITIFAENRVNVERTLRSLNMLTCHAYEACFYVNTREGSIFSHPPSLGHLMMLVSQLSQASGAEVTYKSIEGCIEVLGTERAVRNAYQRIHEMSFMKIYHRETVFNVELSIEQREFISGKKNGKINKIMKTSGVKIKFLPCNDYNFIIEVASSNFLKALDGLTLLQEELPAEMSFFVPETYHKRIIGVGGKNIQRIMKKYGVYVKFSNAEEFAALGGYYDNEDNVVARTPAKNAMNLDNLKHSVMELVSPRDKDFINQTISVPRQLHRELIRQHNNFIHEIEERTNTTIRWPDRESASEIVTLVGPESQLNTGTQLFLELIPEEYHYRVPSSTALSNLLGDTDIQDKVVTRVKREFNFDLILPTLPISTPSIPGSNVLGADLLSEDKAVSNNASNTQEGLEPQKSRLSMTFSDCPDSPTNSLTSSNSSGPSTQMEEKEAEVAFIFRFTRNNMDCLQSATEVLIQYLREAQVPLFPETKSDLRRPRSDSFADAFPHFNSKLLASVAPPESPISAGFTGYPSFPSYSLFDTGRSTTLDTSWKNSRDMSAGSGNIRAIFDNAQPRVDVHQHESNLDIAGAFGLDVSGGQPSQGLGTTGGLSMAPGSSSAVDTDPWGTTSMFVRSLMDPENINGHHSGYTEPMSMRPERYSDPSFSRQMYTQHMQMQQPMSNTNYPSMYSAADMNMSSMPIPTSSKSLPEMWLQSELRTLRPSPTSSTSSGYRSKSMYSSGGERVLASPTSATFGNTNVWAMDQPPRSQPVASSSSSTKEVDRMQAAFENITFTSKPYGEVSPESQRRNGRPPGFDI